MAMKATNQIIAGIAICHIPVTIAGTLAPIDSIVIKIRKPSFNFSLLILSSPQYPGTQHPVEPLQLREGQPSGMIQPPIPCRW